jgi:hypothetical protein
LLQDAVYKGVSYERMLRHFEGQLGAEARAIAKGMIAEVMICPGTNNEKIGSFNM